MIGQLIQMVVIGFAIAFSTEVFIHRKTPDWKELGIRTACISGTLLIIGTFAPMIMPHIYQGAGFVMGGQFAL